MSVVRVALTLAIAAAACSPDPTPAPKIPVAHTPAGGYGLTFPPPVLGTCAEPLVAGAPDLRGIWKTLRAERDGVPVPSDNYIFSYVERIEQCGDRIVDMGGGTIADARADGTVANGVHDVSVYDYVTPIHVVASYEDGVFVLRPVLIPAVPFTISWLKVTRRLDPEGHMVWKRPDRHLTVTLERVGLPTDGYTKTDTRGPEGGPQSGEPAWRYRIRAVWAFFTARNDS